MKRATNELFKGDENYHISIHALVKRATYRIRCDKCNGDISIHALVKRATYGGDKVLVELGDFNPRPREEGDLGVVEKKNKGNIFQSTPS